MSQKVKYYLGIGNKVLGILCAVMFIVAACRVSNAYIEHAESIIKIENNEVQKD